MTNGKRNRASGHKFERDCANEFRKVGFVNCVTSRSANRARDNQGIDLVNQDEILHGRLPWSVQCKNVKGHLTYGKILSEMPKEANIVNVILHNQTEKVNSRFITKDKFAILYMTDFMKMVNKLRKYESTISRPVVSTTGGGA